VAVQTERHVHRGTTRATGAMARRGWSRYSDRTFYLFVAPWVLGFLGLTVVPLVYALLVSFTNFDGLSGRWHWIGLANYGELAGDPETWASLGRTLLFMAIAVPLGVSGGLGLAVLLNRRMRAVGLFRTIFYVPSVVPVVASAVSWRLLFDRDAGLVNAVIERVGGPVVTWLVDPTVFVVLVAMVLWGLGGGMIILLAGLQGIPGELREAAAIDGANAWQTFRAVVLPLLTPVIFFQVITGIIVSLQTLVQPLLLNPSGALGGGGAGAGGTGSMPTSTDLYMVNVYEQFFANDRFGYGSALLWVLFAIVLLITLVVVRSGRLWVFYEVDQSSSSSQ